jgi:magnesium transporter
MGPDYLLYAQIDALVDSIFPLLEEYGERLEALQNRLIEEPRRDALDTIFQMKKDLLHFRRASWPQREVINGLERGESKLVTEEVRIFLRDCYDHAVQIMDIIETYRELVGGMTDLYHSSVGHRTNEIMKVLTLMASIFIPLTFIAGIYGMNFDPSASPFNMPELSWRFGYPVALGVMAVIGVGMYLLFRRRKWM